jgi:phosphatidylethanolamine-binding protein (PEBP) family uncharacterized protein
MGNRGVKTAVVAAAGALALTAALGGCGGATKTTAGAVTVAGAARVDGKSGLAWSLHVLTRGSAARQAAGDVPSSDVAIVQHTPITKASFEHWMKVTAALGHTAHEGSVIHAALQLKVLEFLISSQWVLGEAAARGVSVSEAQVRERLHQISAKRYPTPAALAKYLASVDESEADLRFRVKLELLEAAIAQQVTGGHTTGAHATAQLSAFQQSVKRRWRPRTRCGPEYVMEDCSQYRPPPTPAQVAAATERRGVGGKRIRGKRIPSEPGPMSISSPAFPAEGTIPKRYTCAGADISPPLSWRNVPARAQELVLFAIDTSNDGPNGTTRWLLAGINPHSTGVAAGATPPGAVLGTNSDGGVDYGTVCPYQHKPATIEFVLWALDKKVSLSEGFTITEGTQAFHDNTIASAIFYGTARSGDIR